jgi:hypothetical protein
MEEQKQDQNHSESSDNSEKVIVCKPKTVSDGSKCDHEFVQDYIDAEGKIHEQCSKCWQGRWK